MVVVRTVPSQEGPFVGFVLHKYMSRYMLMIGTSSIPRLVVVSTKVSAIFVIVAVVAAFCC